MQTIVTSIATCSTGRTPTPAKTAREDERIPAKSDEVVVPGEETVSYVLP